DRQESRVAGVEQCLHQLGPLVITHFFHDKSTKLFLALIIISPGSALRCKWLAITRLQACNGGTALHWPVSSAVVICYK
ncbi:MAG: hypothetical protein SPL48_05345, partial [Bacteroidales bacterium]|nr:hypothetical protein [Bacteroidales bacterium]